MVRLETDFFSDLSASLIASSKEPPQHARPAQVDMQQHGSPAASTVHQNPAITYLTMAIVTVTLPRKQQPKGA